MLAAVVVASGAPGCYGATEISVAVTTTIACSPTVGLTTQIFTGAMGTTDFGTAPAAETTACGATEPRVGTLSLVPGGARDGQFDLEVVGAVGVSPADCRDASLGRGAAAPGAVVPSTPTGCVVARRRVSFRPHKSLTVPVLLSAKCIGVSCGADETCDLGVCTRAAECTDDGCPRERGEVVVDAGPDGVDAADVFVPDAPVDTADAADAAPPRCTTTPEVVIDGQNILGQLSMNGDDLVYADRSSNGTEVRRVPRGGVSLAPGLRKTAVAELTAVTTGPTGIAWAVFSGPVGGVGQRQLRVTVTPTGAPPVTAMIAAAAGTQSIAFAGSQVVGVTSITTGFVAFATTGTAIGLEANDALPGASSEVLSDTRGHFYGVAKVDVGMKAAVFHATGGAMPTLAWKTQAPFMEGDIALANDMIYFVVPTPTAVGGPAVGIHRLAVDVIPPAAYAGVPWSTAVIPTSMAADPTTLYQLASDVIYTTPLTVPAPTDTSATMLTPTGTLAAGLQVDDLCVYWIEGGTRIMRRSKK
jgi:hypothetical protein